MFCIDIVHFSCFFRRSSFQCYTVFGDGNGSSPLAMSRVPRRRVELPATSRALSDRSGPQRRVLVLGDESSPGVKSSLGDELNPRRRVESHSTIDDSIGLRFLKTFPLSFLEEQRVESLGDEFLGNEHPPADESHSALTTLMALDA